MRLHERDSVALALDQDRQELRLGLLWTRPRYSKIPYAQVGMANQHPILSNPRLMEVSDDRSGGPGAGYANVYQNGSGWIFAG